MAPPEWYVIKCQGMRWQRLKQPARAIECLTKALEIMRPLPDLTRDTGTTLNYLAFVYFQDEQFTEAETTIREAIAYRMRLPPDEHELAADDYMILANVLSKQGRHREAFEAGTTGVSLYRKGRTAPDYIRQMKDRLRQLKRNLADAEKRERRALRAPSRSL